MPSSQGTYMSTPTAAKISQNAHKYTKRKQRSNPAASAIRASDESSNDKSFNSSEKTNDSGSYTERKVEQGLLLPGKLKPGMAERKTFVKISRQHPKLYDRPKIGKIFNHSVALVREEITKDKILQTELSTRLTEAKLSLAGLDSSKGKPSTAVIETGTHDPGPKQPGHVSFLSVSRRVANIIRFRQAAQPRKPGIPLDKEISSWETNILPKTPRFSSYMSPAAQYALMKGYEDIIFEKLSSKYPECTGMLKRNKTPHHGIVISDNTNFGIPVLKNIDDELNCHQHDEDCGPVGNTLNGKKSDSELKEPESEIAVSEPPGALPELKGQLYASKKRTPEGANELTPKIQTSSESFDNEAFQPSNLRNGSKISSLSPNLFNEDDKTKNFWKYGIRNTSYQSLQETASMASYEALGRNRRIHLSYRIENAMDILDTMKTKTEHALSPRVKVHSRRHIVPLHDFNRWTDQWANEFNHDVVK